MLQATCIKEQLNGPAPSEGTGGAGAGAGAGAGSASAATSDKHHASLVRLLATELECEVSDIKDFELCLFDTQVRAQC